MKKNILLDIQQFKNVEKNAAKRLGSEFQLMENAGFAAFKIIRKFIKNNSKILFLCGYGNNAGDAFIIAHLCEEKSFNFDILFPDIFSAESDIIAKLTPSARQAFSMVKSKNQISIKNVNYSDYDIIIDGLIGTGISRKISGNYAEIINKVNKQKSLKIAIDIPTGINSDNGDLLGCAFKADITISFFLPKIGHFIYPGKEYRGKLRVKNIAIKKIDYANEKIKYHLNDPKYFSAGKKKYARNINKYDKGHVFIIAGSNDKIGATKLAAQAALRNSGLVTILCDPKSYPIINNWTTSIMTRQYFDISHFTEIISDKKISSFVYGMGAEIEEETKEKVFALLATKKPLVIDASALTVFNQKMEINGESENFLKKLHNNVILTPHEGEFDRLFSGKIDCHNRLEKTKNAAIYCGCKIVLKGNDTIIANEKGEVIINYKTSANLATAGSGDVLAGIIGGNIAKSHNIFKSSAKAVWLHAQAGRKFKSSMIADDLIDALLIRK